MHLLFSINLNLTFLTLQTSYYEDLDKKWSLILRVYLHLGSSRVVICVTSENTAQFNKQTLIAIFAGSCMEFCS